MLLSVSASESNENSCDPSGKTVFYADAARNAAGYQGDGSEEKPFSSLPEAYAAAVESGKCTEKETVVFLKAGTYILPAELAMDSDRPITISGETSGKERAVVTTAAEIPGSAFRKVDGKPYYVYQLPDSAKNEKGEYPKFRDLYLNQKALRLAGTKTGGVFSHDTCANIDHEEAKVEDRLLYVEPELLENARTDDENFFVNEKGERMPMEMWIRVEWQVHCIRVEQIVENKIGLTGMKGNLQAAVRVTEGDWNLYAIPRTYYKTLYNRTYWFRNSLAYLENAGEFYYDNKGGLIYLCPDCDISTAVVSYPQAERILNLSGAKNLTLENLTFYGVTENFISDHGYIAGQAGRIKSTVDGNAVGFLPLGAIYAQDAENVTIRNCEFHDVGADAVNFRGAVENVTVDSCIFRDISGSAVRFGPANSEYSETQHNKNIRIVNNYMDNIGTVFISNPSVVVTSVLHLDLSHNTILNSAYSAISIGFNWGSVAGLDASLYDCDDYVNVKDAVVSHNHIQNFMMRMKDGGAIYVLGGNATENYAEYLNSMNHNYVVMDSRTGEHTGGWTVYYHDQGASHWHDFDNVIVMEADMQLPISDYFAYQTIGGPFATCRNFTENCTVIGYPFRKESEAEDFVRGQLLFGKSYPTTVKEINEKCGAACGSGENGDLGCGYKRAENIVFAESFGDLPKEVYEKVGDIYEKAGSALLPKPIPFGVQPKAEK